jgi:hypothetical protein
VRKIGFMGNKKFKIVESGFLKSVIRKRQFGEVYDTTVFSDTCGSPYVNIRCGFRGMSDLPLEDLDKVIETLVEYRKNFVR